VIDAPAALGSLAGAILSSWVFCALAACTAPSSEPATIKIAAASDLAFAFKDVGAVFETKTGIKPVFSFGSSGLLAKQIIEGAPFDVYAAANVAFVDDVIRAGRW
jgi:molybdate transport system substrate-binding protein